MSWRGSHIQVDQTATDKQVWSRWRCFSCRKKLVRGRDIEEGLHARCRRRAGEAESEGLRQACRQADRERYRFDREAGKITPA
jgi:hypothetical protein